MASPRDGFGGATATSSGMQYEIVRMKENVATPPLRILPSMHSLRASGQWTKWHGIHFGYSGVDKKDKTKTRQKPFECIEKTNRQTKMIEVNCDECNLIKVHKKLKLDAEAAATAEAKLRGILDEAGLKKYLEVPLKQHNEWLKNHNKDNKWYINCVMLDGRLALLQIPGKCKVLLDKKIDEVRAKGLEPISNFDQGVYFTFTRTGNFNQSSFTVDIFSEQGSTPGSFSWKIAPIPDDVLEKALQFLPDLDTGVTRRISADQIKLLTECSGDPSEVDTIMGMNQLPDGLDDQDSSGGDVPPPPQSVMPTTPMHNQVAVQQAAAAQAAAAGVQAAAVAAAQAAQLASMRAAAAVTPVLPPAVAPVVPVPAQAAPAVPAVETTDQMRARIEAEIRKQVEAQLATQIKAQAVAPVAPAPASIPAPVTTTTHTATPNVAPGGIPLDPMDPSMSPQQFAALFPK